MRVAPLPHELAAWCQGVLGAFRVTSAHDQSHGEARVWRMETGGGAFYLKAHRQERKWHREVHAYERWRSAMGEEAPRLVAAREEAPRALLTAELPGLVMERAGLSPEQERAAWQAAGVWLARLHALPAPGFFGSCQRDGRPWGEPVTDAVAEVRGQLEHWTERGERAGRLTPAELATARRGLEQVAVFEGEAAVACHMDYSPRNWIVSEAGAWVGVIDLEHTRWEPRVMDFNRWWDDAFLTRPDLERAFFAGYGRDLTERERAQLFVGRVLNGIGTIVWGGEHEDEAFVEMARAAMRRLRDLGIWPGIGYNR